MQFPHTGVSPLIQLLGVTILKWDFFFCAGDINWCLIWSIGSHFPKKIKQTTDGLRRELPKALSQPQPTSHLVPNFRVLLPKQPDGHFSFTFLLKYKKCKR